MIVRTRIESPLGELLAGATDEGICLLEFDGGNRALRESDDLVKKLGTEICDGINSHIEELKNQLKEYFDGTRKEFSLPLVIPGTEFQKEVWTGLLNIGYGTTRTYLEQAEALGKPDAVRAVARANGMNRISILIPCHRVIGSDGRLTGYGGGLKRKKWLLEHERKHSGLPVDMVLF